MNMKRITKRVSDVFVASILLIILLPILCLGSLTVLFSMGRPIFFCTSEADSTASHFEWSNCVQWSMTKPAS